MATPSFTYTAPTTINQTSFAVAYLDATTLVLDGVALIGEKRKEKFHAARRRLASALLYSTITEEQILARQLLATLNFYDQRGLDV